jgi:tetratricopeptide (TPR) repeat protein
MSLGLVLAMTAATPAQPPASEIRWRYDYVAARSEAQQSGLPLFLDFSTDWCFYCKKLDTTTFKDAEIVRLLNEQYVPVKLDGAREKRLVEALQLQGYPTLIVAAPDGRILKTIEGYVTAARLRPVLAEAAATASNPPWMLAAQEEATRCLAAGDYPRAIALLQSVLADERQRPVQLQARRQLDALEQSVQEELARLRQQADQGHLLLVLEGLEKLTRTYAGTRAAREAAAWHAELSQRPEVQLLRRRHRAAQMLQQARQDHRDQNLLCCLDRCSILALHYGDLPEGAEASKMLDQLKSDPQSLQAAAEALADRLCETYLALAECWIQRGEMDLALTALQQAASVPGARQGETARLRLAQLRNQPAPANR